MTDWNGGTTEPYNDKGHRTKEMESAVSQKKQSLPGEDPLILILFQNMLSGSATFSNIWNRGESKRHENCWLTPCFEEGEMPWRTAVQLNKKPREEYLINCSEEKSEMNNVKYSVKHLNEHQVDFMSFCIFK